MDESLHPGVAVTLAYMEIFRQDGEGRPHLS